MGPWIIILLALVMITPGTALGQASPSGCKSYKPAVIELHGTMIRKTFPGPPNYDDIHKGDRAETYWLLKLDSPVCVDESKVSPDLNPAQKNIRSVQLVLDEGGYKKYRELVGKHVVTTGSLFGQITAHHHAPVLLQVKSIEVAK